LAGALPEGSTQPTCTSLTISKLVRDLNSITTVVHAVSTKVESQSCGLCVVIEVACKEKTSMQKLCMYKNEPDTRGG